MFALAIVAYQAYGESTEWKTFRNEPMLSWEELPPYIQAAWLAAAEAVQKVVQNGN